MIISGIRSQYISFLQNLNPKKLADLAADLLAVRGHKEIQIVDGPGDGCRDIHSIDPDAKKHLTQCKYHVDINHTVSSREIGELPLGMIKLGYQRGLFITNASISPQAKREFLDNYSTLSLEFYEGSEVVPLIFSNQILRSIWFDGNRLIKLVLSYGFPS